MPNPSELARNEEESAGDMLHRLGIDGQKWADEFLKTFPAGCTDRGTLIGWFANAIMAGYDHDKGPINGDHAEFLLGKQQREEAEAQNGERF